MLNYSKAPFQVTVVVLARLYTLLIALLAGLPSFPVLSNQTLSNRMWSVFPTGKTGGFYCSNKTSMKCLNSTGQLHKN